MSSNGKGIPLAVVGAHLRGQPLNHQLTDLASVFVCTTRTAPVYRLYALGETHPPKPGMVRVEPRKGASIEVEVWELSVESFGAFVEKVPPPLTIGAIELEDGTLVKGFLCESYAVTDANDITEFGGWRAYLDHTGDKPKQD